MRRGFHAATSQQPKVATSAPSCHKPRMLDSALPIDAVLGDIRAHLAVSRSLVLVAPPGAGKTTRVPPALLGQPWLGDKKIILLEPRRLAARAASERMAANLGEQVGETIGLRVRMQSRVSAKTRIEVVTEGVFARMVLDDPEMAAVGLVIFDEFHERSLDADLGLALALDVQKGLREDLRLLVMSATLDGARVARLLGDAEIIESQGRAFPVETRHVPRDSRARLEDEVVRVILRALAEDTGSLLVFLPGQGEILRVAAMLDARIANSAIDIAPLYGAMDRAAQDRAVGPAAPGRRKIVLATSIAETSLTIDGVRVVVDCGLSRVARYEPDLGLTRLETVRVSRAGADQRRGRAGRTQQGICYRMWEAAGTGALEAFSPPEILAADLSGLVLDLADWGVRDMAQMAWLDPPPVPAVKEARKMLHDIAALDASGAITAQGKAIRALPLPPRLARMVLSARALGEAPLAADMALVMVERGLGGVGCDMAGRVQDLRRDPSQRAQDGRKLARSWAAGARHADLSACGPLLALAFPDRMAKARGKPGEFLMCNGRAAMLEPHLTLAREPFLAIGEIAGRAGAARILLAAALTQDDVLRLGAGRVEIVQETRFDSRTMALRARKIARLDAMVLNEQALPVVAGPDAARALARGLAALGIGALGLTKAQNQWRDRVMFLARAGGADWPDVSDAALAANCEAWLAPFIETRTSLAAITPGEIEAALKGLLPWDLARRLEAEAPTHFTTPAGSSIALDYEAEGGPVLAVRVQELFGLAAHPALAGGRVPLTLHLLSPAHRPLQITRDLPGFWRGSWQSVKTEMKGRYPRHSWPDDPAAAAATSRAKPRGG